jgi:hypothetical protein
LSNKKALFWNMVRYYRAMGEDPWKALPVTFHIEHGEKDVEWQNFIDYFEAINAEIKVKVKERDEEM